MKVRVYFIFNQISYVVTFRLNVLWEYKAFWPSGSNVFSLSLRVSMCIYPPFVYLRKEKNLSYFPDPRDFPSFYTSAYGDHQASQGVQIIGPLRNNPKQVSKNYNNFFDNQINIDTFSLNRPQGGFSRDVRLCVVPSPGI